MYAQNQAQAVIYLSCAIHKMDSDSADDDESVCLPIGYLQMPFNRIDSRNQVLKLYKAESNGKLLWDAKHLYFCLKDEKPYSNHCDWFKSNLSAVSRVSKELGIRSGEYVGFHTPKLTTNLMLAMACYMTRPRSAAQSVLRRTDEMLAFIWSKVTDGVNAYIKLCGRDYPVRGGSIELHTVIDGTPALRCLKSEWDRYMHGGWLNRLMTPTLPLTTVLLFLSKVAFLGRSRLQAARAVDVVDGLCKSVARHVIGFLEGALIDPDTYLPETITKTSPRNAALTYVSAVAQ